eukprot:6203181-Pleurochrysis_carterae.AAC.5
MDVVALACKTPLSELGCWKASLSVFLDLIALGLAYGILFLDLKDASAFAYEGHNLFLVV